MVSPFVLKVVSKLVSEGKSVPNRVVSPPRKIIMKSSRNRGFSLLEMMIVIAIGLIMAGVTFISMKPLFKQNHVDAAYDTTLSVIRNYRTCPSAKANATSSFFTPPEPSPCSTGAWACRCRPLQ